MRPQVPTTLYKAAPVSSVVSSRSPLSTGRHTQKLAETPPKHSSSNGGFTPAALGAILGTIALILACVFVLGFLLRRRKRVQQMRVIEETMKSKTRIMTRDIYGEGGLEEIIKEDNERKRVEFEGGGDTKRAAAAKT